MCKTMQRLFSRLARIVVRESDQLEALVVKLTDRVIHLEDQIMSLAEFIKQQSAIERGQGQILLDKIDTLTAALDAANKLLEQLNADSQATPGLKLRIVELEKEIADATEAAKEISEINPTPFSDAIVTEVIENEDIVTPPVVEQAPPVSTETVQETAVVDAAIDALETL